MTIEQKEKLAARGFSVVSLDNRDVVILPESTFKSDDNSLGFNLEDSAALVGLDIRGFRGLNHGSLIAWSLAEK